MKMNTQFKATLVAIEEQKTSDNKNTYYKLAVLQGAECSTISCTKDVFVARPQVFKEHVFALQIGEYDGKTTFRVTAVGDVPSVNSSAPTDGAKK